MILKILKNTIFMLIGICLPVYLIGFFRNEPGSYFYYRLIFVSFLLYFAGAFSLLGKKTFIMTGWLTYRTDDYAFFNNADLDKKNKNWNMNKKIFYSIPSFYITMTLSASILIILSVIKLSGM